MINRRLENLDKLKGNHASLGERLQELEQKLAALEEQRTVIYEIVRNLDEAAEEPIPPAAN